MSKKRGSFSGGLGFVFAAAGSAVGLGNLWRFPYYAAKYGGGTFIFIYIILALTFGFLLLICRNRNRQKNKAKSDSRLQKAMQQIFVFRLPCNACSYNHYSVLLRYRRLGYKIYVRLCTGTCCPCGTGQLFLGLYFRPVVTHCVFLNIYAVECSGNYARSKQGH